MAGLWHESSLLSRRLIGDQLGVEKENQTFPDHLAQFRQQCSKLLFLVDGRDRDRAIIRNSEQPLVMQALVVPEAEDAGMGGRAGDVQLTQAMNERVIERNVVPPIRFVDEDQQ